MTQASFSSRVLNEYLSVQEYSCDASQSRSRFWIWAMARHCSVLTTGPRGAVLLIEWKNFRALLPIGMSFEALDELRNGASVGPVSVLSLADSGYATIQPAGMDRESESQN